MKRFATIITHLLTRFKSSSYWKDIAWLASGTVAAQAISLASMPIFSRLYAPSDFAIQNLFVHIVGFVTVASTLRYEYFVQLPKRYRDGVRVVQLVAIMGSITAILLTPVAWAFRDIFAAWAGDASLAPWLAFVPVTAMVTSLSVAVQGGVQRRRLFRRSGESEIVSKMSFSSTVLAGHLLLPGAGGLVLAWLASPCIKIVWLLKGTKWLKCSNVSGYTSLARKYSHMSASLVLSHIFLSFTGAIPAVFIARTYGSAALGQYALAFQAVYLPTALLGGAIGSVYYQRASERWSQGLAFSDIWRSTAKKLLIIGVPIYGAAIIIMPWIFPLAFGKVWQTAGRYGAVLAISSFFSFVTSPMDKACLVAGIWWYAPLWHALRAITTGAVVAMALYFKWGIDSYIAILVLQQSVMYLIDYWAEWRFASIIPPLKET